MGRVNTMRFAQYDSREIKTQYFNGAWYVVRRDMYPHTTFTPAYTYPVTRQGMSYSVGIRQGTSDSAGFTWARYERPDTWVSGE